VALLDIAVTSIDLGGEFRTQEFLSGLEKRDQFLGGQNAVGKTVSIRVVLDLADRLHLNNRPGASNTNRS
jgi:hypothetical protein